MSNEPESTTPPQTKALAKAEWDFNPFEPSKTLNQFYALAQFLAPTAKRQASELAYIMIVAEATYKIPAVRAASGSVHFFNGRIVLGANELRIKVKESDAYDYKVIEATDTRCEMALVDKTSGTELGRTSFTIEDAKKAGVYERNPNYKAWPKRMLVARCSSDLVTIFCPEVVGGEFILAEAKSEYVDLDDPQPSVAETAATAAMERAQKVRGKKAEPKSEPEPEVIEAEFTPEVEPEAGPVPQEPVAPEAPAAEPAQPLHVEMGGPESTLAQMAEQAISAGEYDPLAEGAEMENRFSLIEGWGEPEPMPGLTPDIGVVGYHHYIAKKDGDKTEFWAVFDRETALSLDKIQMKTGDQANFNYMLLALQQADQAFRYKEPDLNKGCNEKGSNGQPTTKARVCLAVKAMREAKNEKPSPSVAPPDDPIDGDDGEEMFTLQMAGADGLESAVSQYKAVSEKAGKDISGFWPVALELIASSKLAEMSPSRKLTQVSNMFMSWKKGASAEVK